MSTCSSRVNTRGDIVCRKSTVTLAVKITATKKKNNCQNSITVKNNNTANSRKSVIVVIEIVSILTITVTVNLFAYIVTNNMIKIAPVNGAGTTTSTTRTVNQQQQQQQQLQQGQIDYLKEYRGKKLPQDVIDRAYEVSKSRAVTTQEIKLSKPIPVWASSDIQIDYKELGSGSFSCAYEIKDKPNVVMKKLSTKVLSNPLLFAACASDLIHEGMILASIRSHPNVISIQAWSGSDMVNSYLLDGNRDGCFLVLDKLHQTLDNKFQKWYDETPGGIWNYLSSGGNPTQNLNWQTMWLDKSCAIQQMVSALDHLHSYRILHRDLKPQNIGFDSANVLKVYDFDLARVLPSPSKKKQDGEKEEEDKNDKTLFKLTGKVGSPRYMAPEVKKGEMYNLKADVYSFGILVYQILSLEKPYTGIPRDWSEQNSPSIPPAWSNEIRVALEHCLSQDSSHRPTMNYIQRLFEPEVERIRRDIDGLKEAIDLQKQKPTWGQWMTSLVVPPSSSSTQEEGKGGEEEEEITDPTTTPCC